MKANTFQLPGLFLIALLVSACAIEPQPIDYGREACHFCQMTIVDKQHAAELVTTKGKAFKYDAIECMVNDLKRRDKESIALFLTSDYENPGNLIDARESYFLISEAIQSPMGENLSAFSSEWKVRKKIDAVGGEMYNWRALQQKFKD